MPHKGVMKKKIKYNKDQNWEILCLLLIIFFLFMAGRNYYKIKHLEKFGIIETVVVRSCSVRKTHTGRSGTHYHVKMEYSRLGENLLQSCSFNFKPNEDYYENERIQIIRDSKNDFKLPVNEKEGFKREEIICNLLKAFSVLLLALISKFLDYIFEKNRNRNKKSKKLAKKNPELKEKYKNRGKK